MNYTHTQFVMMDKFSLRIPPTPIMELICMGEGWRCVVVICSTLCAMMDGPMKMLQLSAQTWATALHTTVSGKTTIPLKLFLLTRC